MISGFIADSAKWVSCPKISNAGKLSILHEMFVGWCVAHNAVKLALDLRNEASCNDDMLLMMKLNLLQLK